MCKQLGFDFGEETTNSRFGPARREYVSNFSQKKSVLDPEPGHYVVNFIEILKENTGWMTFFVTVTKSN